MKRAVIVHCWGGNPNYVWYPAVKKSLENAGFEVFVPEMPDTEHPKLKDWLEKLSQTIVSPDSDLYLIGHSLGCLTILRYLEEMPVGNIVGGVVMVAGFSYDNLGFSELKNFFEPGPIDFTKVKNGAREFVAIHSDNDPYVSLDHGDIFKEKLEAKLIVKHNAWHFSSSSPDDGGKDGECLDLPTVVEEIVRMNK